MIQVLLHVHTAGKVHQLQYVSPSGPIPVARALQEEGSKRHAEGRCRMQSKALTDLAE